MVISPHRRVAIANLENAAARAGGRIVHPLEQLNTVEDGDLAHYGHGLMLALGYAVTSRGAGGLIGVVPCRRDR